MRRSAMAGAVLAAFVIGCGRASDSGIRDDSETPVEDASPADTSRAPSGQVPEEGGQREGVDRPAMPMGRSMAEMHARMMGGGEPGEAPEVRAAAAEAAGCPDITQELVDEGQEVFGGTGVCFACHGGDASGTQLAPDLTDQEWLNVDGSYGTIGELIRTGVAEPLQYPAPMPPMGGASLSAEQVCAVAAYVYSLSH